MYVLLFIKQMQVQFFLRRNTLSWIGETCSNWFLSNGNTDAKGKNARSAGTKNYALVNSQMIVQVRYTY